MGATPSGETWARWVDHAVLRGVVPPEARDPLLHNARAAGRPPWELAAARIGAQAAARLVVELLEASPPPPCGRVVGELGRGGMGRVLRVHDEEAGRDVARKVLLDASPSVAVRERFLREARITAQLEHPSIVPVYEVQADPSAPAFSMRLVKGRALSDVIAAARDGREPAPIARLLGPFLRVCEAVAYAHERGVIHRDLKPQNVMVGDFGEVLVLDWGLARVKGEAEPAREPRPAAIGAGPAGGSEGRAPAGRAGSMVEAGGPENLTEEGAVVGTPAYMAPEQVDDASGVDERADVYSLGAVLYELLALRPPFTGGNLAIIKAVLVDAPAPPRAVASGRAIPADLEAIALRALAKDPAARYPSVRALQDDVTRHLDGLPVTARPAGPLRRALLGAARRIELVAGLSVAAVVLLAVALVASGALARAKAEHARQASRGADAERAARAALEARAAAEAERARLAEEAAAEGHRRSEASAAFFEVEDLLPRNLPREVALGVVRPALERVTALDPDLVEAHVALGRLLLVYGDPEAGRASLRRAVEAGRRQGARPDPAALLLLARSDGLADDERRRLLEQARDASPDHPLARLAGAMLRPAPERQGALGALAREMPWRADVVLEWAESLAHDGQPMSAEEARAAGEGLGQALEALRGDPDTQWLLAQCLVERATLRLQLGDVEGAREDVGAADREAGDIVRSAVETGVYLLQSARVHLLTGGERVGEDHLDRAIAIIPRASPSLLMRGSWRLSRGRPADARADLRLAAEVAPDALHLRTAAALHAIAAVEADADGEAAASVAALLEPLVAGELDALEPPFALEDLQGRLRLALCRVAAALAAQGRAAAADPIVAALLADAARQARLAGASAGAEPEAARAQADLGLRAHAAAGARAPSGLRVQLLRSRARACYGLGDDDAAIADLEVVISLAGRSSHAPTRRGSGQDGFDLACVLVRRGQARRLPPAEVADAALSALEAGVERGFADARLLRSALEQVLAPLRDHQRVRALLARLEAR